MTSAFQNGLTNRASATAGLPVPVLRETLAYARERDYAGWDYSDGTSSRLLTSLPVDNRWVNLAFQETVKRAPVNVRPLFLVEQRRNYKGTALFAMANLNLHELLADPGRVESRSGATGSDAAGVGAGHGGTGSDAAGVGAGHGGTGATAPGVGMRADRLESDRLDYAAEAQSLVEWLVRNRCRGYSGFCGGHQHDVQHLRTKGTPEDPDVVSTSYAVRALLAAERFDPAFGTIARSAADFVVDDLRYREVEDGPTDDTASARTFDGGAKIDYHLNHPPDVYTYNAGALGARLFVDLYDRFGDEELLERATAILDYVADAQHPKGGWTYREPADSSHLSMDNHHNGFVVEAFQRYAEVAGNRYRDTLDEALTFYREVLFEPDGAPNWDETSAYPKDIHACAQGILVFTYAGDYEFAGRILDWTLGNLYAGGGRFYFRKEPLYTKRITLMRWCQAWMAYALSEYLTGLAGDTAGPPRTVADAGRS